MFINKVKTLFQLLYTVTVVVSYLQWLMYYIATFNSDED